MNKGTYLILNKLNTVTLLVWVAIIYFVMQILPVFGVLAVLFQNDAGLYSALQVLAAGFRNSIYQPFVLLGLAKIIQLIQEKTNNA